MKKRLEEQFCIPAAALCAALIGWAAGAKASALEAVNEWPQWRGPLRTGVAPEANPPLEWSEDKNIRWKIAVPGSGSASPVIWGDQVFLQTAIPTGQREAVRQAAPEPPAGGQQGGRRRGGGFGRQEPPSERHQFVLISIDRRTGEEQWRAVAREVVPHEGHHQDHGYASHSTVTDGKSVFAYFGSRGLHAYDMRGNLRWQKDLGRMRTKMGFGEGGSPALADGKIIINWDHEGEDFVVALDAETGEELWRNARDEDTSWATPLVAEHNGKKQVVTAASGKIRSYDLKSGQPLWEGPGLTANVIPTPVAGHGMAYIMSGFRGNELFAIRLDAMGEAREGEAIVWSYPRSTPYVPSPLLYGQRLYFFSHNNGILSCLDAKTGRPLMDAERVAGLQGVYASPLGARGRVYLVGRNGVTVVIRDADRFEVLATNRLEERFDASPAAVGGQLFLRGQKSLYCIAEGRN